MNDPWDIKTNDERVQDTLKTFIIFCEDKHHEPLYLKSFEHLVNVKINAVGNQKQNKSNIINAVDKCTELGLITFKDGAHKVQESIKEHIWCVYDRDLESEDLTKVTHENNYEFDMSIQYAQSVGIKVAWSNDVFELWVLLHFEQVPHDKILHRSYVYTRLTDIFKTVEPRSPELDILTSRHTFNYKANLKRRDAYINHVRPLLHLRRDTAITNAKLLEAQFTPETPYHLRNPCTMIHHLINEIIN